MIIVMKKAGELKKILANADPFLPIPPELIKNVMQVSSEYENWPAV